jgi:DNA-binding transcriptional regulator YiaG
MYCENCGKALDSKIGRYHYKECGLDYVWLDGIEIYYCSNSKCELNNESLGAIPKAELLHSMLAKAIIANIFPFTGKESRFLRTYFRLKSKQWAELLTVSAETVSRWETGFESIGAQSDFLMRLLSLRLLEEKEQSWIPEIKTNQIISARKTGQHSSIFIKHNSGQFLLEKISA